MFKNVILLALLVLGVFGAKLSAHDADQVAYHFKANGELSIHLTPETALYLMHVLKPELQLDSTIQLSDYHKEFSKYLQEHIQLKLGEQLLALHFLRADLADHDALIIFKLLGFSGSYKDFFIKIDAFTDLYQNTRNHIRVDFPGGFQACELDLNNLSCEYSEAAFIQDIKVKDSTLKESLSQAGFNCFYLLTGLILIGGGIFILLAKGRN